MWVGGMMGPALRLVAELLPAQWVRGPGSSAHRTPAACCARQLREGQRVCGLVGRTRRGPPPDRWRAPPILCFRCGSGRTLDRRPCHQRSMLNHFPSAARPWSSRMIDKPARPKAIKDVWAARHPEHADIIAPPLMSITLSSEGSSRLGVAVEQMHFGAIRVGLSCILHVVLHHAARATWVGASPSPATSITLSRASSEHCTDRPSTRCFR